MREVSQTLRVLVCFLRLLEEGSLFYSFVIFFQKGYYISFFGLIIQKLYITFLLSIIDICFVNYQRELVLKRFLWEFFYIIPQGNLKDYLHSVLLVNEGTKLYLHLIQFLWLQILILFYEDNSIWIATQVFSSLLVKMLEFCMEDDQKSIFKGDLRFLNFTTIFNLSQGYFLLCHRSWYILLYYAFLIAVCIIITKSSIIKNIHFNPFYENEVINSDKQLKICATILWMNIGSQMNFSQKQLAYKNLRTLEIENVQFIIQSLFTILLFNTDLLINDLNKQNNYSTILQLQIPLFLYKFVHSLVWLKKYLTLGPFGRKIFLKDDDIDSMTAEYVVQDYLNIKSYQQYINLKIENIQIRKIENIALLLFGQDKIVRITHNYDLSKRKQNVFKVNQHEKVIEISVYNFEFAFCILRAINKSNYLLNYKISIWNDENIKNLIIISLIKNFEILARVEWNQQILKSSLVIILSYFHSISTYYKYIYPYMLHSPQQVLYDLFEL